MGNGKAPDEIKFNEEKFRQLIIYIAGKCEKDFSFGATKLNKTLFYADFIAYRNLGHSITGAEYFALDYGPAPKPLLRVREKMIMQKDIAIAETSTNTIYLHRIVALKNSNLSKFTADEISIVDSVIHFLYHKSSERVSLISHAFLGWKAAWEEGKKTNKPVTIPYGTVFVSNPQLDEFEQAHGLALAQKYGWVA